MFPDNREASQGPKVGLTGAPQRPPLLPSVAVASEKEGLLFRRRFRSSREVRGEKKSDSQRSLGELQSEENAEEFSRQKSSDPAVHRTNK
ncbi:hypothetical protein F7725_012502, partial [Dissostichus mawsoni]